LNTGVYLKPAAVVLAGGASSRLGPGSKAMITLGGMPMIQHVIRRIEEQADPLLISTQDNSGEFDAMGLQPVVDAIPRHRGPLIGLYSAMQYVFRRTDLEWLLLTPCDAPFIPLDLAGRLQAEAEASGKPVSVACYEQVPQPTFSLWHRSVLPPVRKAVMNEGKGGLMNMLDQLPWCGVDWKTDRIPPFFNVNTRADLEMAKSLLDRLLDRSEPAG
jgi:molybdopterin-guanine dinucleotide biosynthesis protein A